VPTFLAIAGAEPAADRELDGVDLSGLLRGGEAPAARPLHWHFPCYLQGRSDRFERFRTTPGGSLRSGRWKLIEYFHPGSAEAPRLELYDLGPFPMAIANAQAQWPVSGELYRLNAQQLQALDRFEGAPRLYQRTLHVLADGREAWVYLGTRQQVRFVRAIPNGCWRGSDRHQPAAREGQGNGQT